MSSEPAVQSAGLYANKLRGNLLCRYFVNNGVCNYGSNCQYVHDMPASNSPSIYTEQPPTDERIDSMDGLVGCGRNADQYFKASFQQQNANSMPLVSDYSTPPPAVLPVLSDARLPPPFVSQFGSMSTPRLESETISTLARDTSSPLQSTRIRSPLPHSHSLISSPYHSSPSTSNSTLAIQEDVGGTTYFYTQDDMNNTGVPVVTRPVPTALPQYTVYPGPMPHVAHMKLLKSKSGAPTYFMPDELKMEILNRQVLTCLQLDPAQNSGLPAEVDNYHKLHPLELPHTNPLHKSSTFGYQTSVYKAVNTKDGLTYCLRRIHEFRLINTKCMSDIELWKRILHPNLVHLREVFTTKTFGDHSMVFVYDYHAGAETLISRHFGSNSGSNSDAMFGSTGASPKFRNAGTDPMLTPSGTLSLPEALIWTYIVQLSSVLRTIHGHGLACRVMDPTKILLVDRTRIRLNCVGVFDVLSFDPNLQSGSSQMERYKQEDLTSLGRVVLSLANNSVQCLQSPAAAISFVSRVYSTDLKNLILYLMTPQARPRNINDVMPMIGARFYSQLEATHLRNDVLEQALTQEVENGRLFKLLCKLGTINERPEYEMDSSWSETGDRYMLKLFRDYLFHQVDADGHPWIDMAHIIQSLNKLNAGIPEKICLSSRDDEIIVLVSYAELKRCVETSFSDLTTTRPRTTAPTTASGFS